MTPETIANTCTVWRADGPIKTQPGRLEITVDGAVRFRVANEIQWTSTPAEMQWKKPWYSLGASLRIQAPDNAKGLYMAYPPGAATSLTQFRQTKSARHAIKQFENRLKRPT